jgi:peptide deformylase
MAVRPIVRLGHPALRSPAEAVPADKIGSGELAQLIDDLIETMRDAEGVGLAAPQVGVSLQLFVYEHQPEPEPEAEEDERQARASAAIPLTVVVNPMLTIESAEAVFDWEGCLSIPDFRGLVPRARGVRLRGLGRQGEALDLVATDFAARIIQHEFDHLNGVVFLDRMRDLKSLAFRAEWEEYLLPQPATATASNP